MVVLFVLTACAKTAPIEPSIKTLVVNNQFQSVWKQITSNPVKKLPNDSVSYRKLFFEGKDIITRNSLRTLDSHANILPSFNKLAHPNGICFKGVWSIHTKNRYSGYFKKNSKALIIVRASSAMSNTRRGKIRSFGFAGCQEYFHERTFCLCIAILVNLAKKREISKYFRKTLDI